MGTAHQDPAQLDLPCQTHTGTVPRVSSLRKNPPGVSQGHRDTLIFTWDTHRVYGESPNWHEMLRNVPQPQLWVHICPQGIAVWSYSFFPRRDSLLAQPQLTQHRFWLRGSGLSLLGAPLGHSREGDTQSIISAGTHCCPRATAWGHKWQFPGSLGS